MRMLKPLTTAILFGLLAAGCADREPDAVEAVVTQPPVEASSDEVVLDVGAQRDAGVEIEAVDVQSSYSLKRIESLY